MSEILQPCPFCGGEARKVTETIDPDDLDFMTFDDIDYPDCFEITCANERCISGWYLSPKDWNTRPIEDDLRARIAELEARAEKAEAMVEKLNSWVEKLMDVGWGMWRESNFGGHETLNEIRWEQLANIISKEREK